MKVILIIIFILILFDRNDRPRRGGGYQPRPAPTPNGIYTHPTPPRPPGYPPFPGPFYTLKGMRWPWDIRPRWLWEDRWTIDDLPYGVKWADEIKANIAKNEAQWKRPPPPAPMRPMKP